MGISVKAPLNDHNRLIWLKTITREIARDSGNGRNWITGALKNQLTNLQTSYEQSVAQNQVLVATRQQLVASGKKSMDKLTRSVRIARQSLRGMVREDQLKPEDLNLYKLPVDGIFTDPTTYETWLSAARVLLTGNAEAVAAGLPPLVMPTPEVLQAHLDAAEAAREAIVAAKDAVRQEMANQQALRQELATLWQTAANALRTAMTTYPAGARREEMRRYGFVFRGAVVSDGGGGAVPVDGGASDGDDGGDGGVVDPTSGGADGGVDPGGSGDGGAGDAGGDGAEVPTEAGSGTV